MAVILIRNIDVKTIGGWAASIDGIDPTDGDLLVGTIQGPHGMINAKWDSDGYLRNGIPDGNLDVNDDDVADALATAKPLRALFP